MSHVRLKAGAAFPVLAPAGIRILAALDEAAQYFNVPLTVTSGSEGQWRAPTDPHMTGEAVDVSVAGLEIEVLRSLHLFLAQTMGAAFTVLLEAPPRYDGPLRGIVFTNPRATGLHLHIQRKKGTVWPPSQSS